MSDFTDDLDWADESDYRDVELEDVEAIGTTDKAVLCVIEGKKHWIPQSQIRQDSEVWKQGDKGTLIISQWIAEQKELL